MEEEKDAFPDVQADATLLLLKLPNDAVPGGRNFKDDLAIILDPMDDIL